MNDKHMKFLKSVGDIDYYEFKPSFGKWYYKNYPEYERMTIPHFIRMTIEYIEGGYRIYYLVKNNSVMGYILVTNGGGRLKCSSARDIVLGPIWISTQLRGRGIGTEGISVVLHKLGIKYNNAYEYIKCSNIASIRSVEKNGYVNIGRAKSVGLLKRIVFDNNGDMFVFKYQSSIDEE